MFQSPREIAIELTGLEPGKATKQQQENLFLRIDSGDTILKRAVVNYLSTQGLPLKGLNSATSHSLASAYCAFPYLRSWRNRVNPSFALLGNKSEADDEVATSNSTPEGRGAESLPSDTPADHTVSAQWLRDLYTQIEATVTKAVQAKVDATTLKLDEGAKQQIRDLAKTSAQAKVEELLPPRQVEIVDRTKGTVVLMGLVHESFDKLLRAVQAKDHKGFRLNVWLTGPTGSGKTSAAEGVAKALGLNFGSDGSLDADYKVLGFRDANGNIISTQFLDIYENGGVYVADEIDNWMPNALLSLNAALANGWVSAPKGMIQRHPDCCVIACANTWGLGATNDYVGRTKLDAASLDRFHPKINWPIDEKLERAVAQAHGATLGIEWHELIVAMRRNAKAQGLKIIVSPRSTFAGISLLQQGFSVQDVAEMTFAAGLSPEQIQALKLPLLARETQNAIDLLDRENAA